MITTDEGHEEEWQSCKSDAACPDNYLKLEMVSAMVCIQVTQVVQHSNATPLFSSQ